MPFVTRIVQVQHINFTLLCAYCQVIVKCFILFCINNSLLHLPDDFQFRKCPVNARRDRCPRCALYSFRNFSRNSLKKLMTKRLMILMMKNRLQLHRNSQSKLFPYQKYLSNRTSRYEVLHPRSLQCEAAERDHRQQIWKYV